jgi:23S rRNA (pseudouridine1915-N3)-methyltransferase
MKLIVIAVGQRVPDWAQTAWDDYAKRFPAEIALSLKTIKTEPRTNNKNTASLMAAERERIEAVIAKEGKGLRVVVLDERGKNTTTIQLASRLSDWQLGGSDVALIIGGPDGLEPDFRKSSHESIRLSDMTLPHAFARVLLVEQLYRAWSVNAGHPYHRE